MVHHRVRKWLCKPFKLQHFAVAHPEDAFPSFTTIAREEIERLREHPCQAAGIAAATGCADLCKHLLNQAEHIKTANAEDESGFNRDAALKSLGILRDKSVFLAWIPDELKWTEWLSPTYPVTSTGSGTPSQRTSRLATSPSPGCCLSIMGQLSVVWLRSSRRTRQSQGLNRAAVDGNSIRSERGGQERASIMTSDDSGMSSVILGDWQP